MQYFIPYFMARRYRRYRHKRSRGYKRIKRKFYGKKKAAAQQRQKGRFVIKSTQYGYITINPTGISEGNTSAPNYGGSAAISVYKCLLASNYFGALVRMYDQFRLDSCKIRIVPTQSVLLQGQKQSIFVSAIDRNGLNDPKSCPSFSEIASYSSAFQKAVNLDASTWACSRKVYASSIQEKSFFIPTANVYNASTGAMEEETAANAFNGQSLQYPWNPQFLIGITCLSTAYSSDAPETPVVQQFPNVQTWNYMCQFEWCVTFRGLRYDSPSASAPIINVSAVRNPVAAIGTTTYNTNPMTYMPAPSVINPVLTPAKAPNSIVSSYYIDDFQISPSTSFILSLDDSVIRQDVSPFTFTPPTVSGNFNIRFYFVASIGPSSDIVNFGILLIENNGTYSFNNTLAVSILYLGYINDVSGISNYNLSFTFTPPSGDFFGRSVDITAGHVLQDRANLNPLTSYDFDSTAPPTVEFVFPFSADGRVVDITPRIMAQAQTNEGLVPVMLLEDDESFDPDPNLI